MTISELISKLERIKFLHGDLEVETYGFDGRRMALNAPKVDARAILRGQESKTRFASEYYGDRDRIGETVCRL